MDIVMSIIICILAVYGVFRLIYGIALYVTGDKKFSSRMSHKLFLADDSSTNIEDYVRGFGIREEGESLIILDLSKSEEMKNLLQILDCQFGFLS